MAKLCPEDPAEKILKIKYNSKGEIMEIKDYMAIIRKRLRIILFLTFVSTLTAFIVSFFVLPEVYESGTTLYVGKQIDVQQAYVYQDILIGQTLVKDYREIAKSKTVTKRVKVELSQGNVTNESLKRALALNDDDFSRKIEVNLKNDTRIIEIKVTDTDPSVCPIIANKVADVFKEKAVELLKLENVQIVDKAEVPEEPVKPNKKLNLAVAFFVGLMAGLGLAFLIEYLDNTIKTPEDVTKHTGLTVIGAIPRFSQVE